MKTSQVVLYFIDNGQTDQMLKLCENGMGLTGYTGQKSPDGQF